MLVHESMIHKAWLHTTTDKSLYFNWFLLVSSVQQNRHFQPLWFLTQHSFVLEVYITIRGSVLPFGLFRDQLGQYRFHLILRNDVFIIQRCEGDFTRYLAFLSPRILSYLTSEIQTLYIWSHSSFEFSPSSGVLSASSLPCSQHFASWILCSSFICSSTSSNDISGYSLWHLWFPNWCTSPCRLH